MTTQSTDVWKHRWRIEMDFAFDRINNIIDRFCDELDATREELLAMPAPIYSTSTQGRVDQLPHPAKWIFEDVLVAMQSADELGGPEGDEYINLMQTIIDEATERCAAAQGAGGEDESK